MKLTRFRIQNYKCILDSDWVNVSDLTVLVGKNETGKTSLLQALYLFNPFKPASYVLARDWPRSFRGEESEAQVVCTAEFQLTPEEIDGVQALANQPVSLDRIQVAKDYLGRFEVLFPKGFFAEKLRTNDIAALCSSLPQPTPKLANRFRKLALDCRAEAIRLSHEGRFSDLAQLPTRQETKLAPRGTTAHQRQLEQTFRNHYFPKLDELSQRLQETSTLQQKAHDFVVQRLPAFVYMDECRPFCGTAELDVIKRRKDHHDLRPEDETFLALLDVAGLNLDDEFERDRVKDDEESRAERQYDLSVAEATLNRKIENHWGQARYQVQFRVDGCRFMTFVKAEDETALFRLEERSKGFQWFFSFDLMLMHETRGRLKNCVILLDEPGLHLHPEGQQDLLKCLAEYARTNTLIYTTHLPYMIDLQEPERIRVITQTERGSVVSENLKPSHRAGSLVVQAALGIYGRVNGQAAEQNLIVTTADNYWILTELSHLFRKSMREGLPPDVLVTPAGGAMEAAYLAAFLAGRGLEVVAMFDSNPAARAARDKLVQGWLPKFTEPKVVTLDFAEAIGNAGQDCSIEDLFPETFYVTRVQKVYENHLPATALSLSALPEGNPLVQRVEAAFRSVNAVLNRRVVGRRIAADIRQMRNMVDLPEMTRLLGEKLFAAIKKAFTR
ncbi:MAG: AAA family ATPase [Verrucomicrobia bacterium]|nr:AAA family ATPase [Verrucomicrobiota bacterium]